ncbi:MAG: glycosyltransferase family 9 protein [Leptospiraceae bacterium]|nr:glycosyltransferase family 9 protein [Leptospiraceae bacterium]
MKILIIRFSSLGDVVLSTPVIAALREKFPHAEIFFLVREEYAPILPNGIKCLAIEGRPSLQKLYALVHKHEPFDAILDLQSNILSRLLSLILRGRKKAHFQKPYLRRLLTVVTKRNFLKNTPPVAERYLTTLHKLWPDYDFHPPMRPLLRRQALPPSLHRTLQKNPYFVIAPGSRHFTKRWPLSHQESLLSLLQKKWPSSLVIFIGSQREREECEYLKQKTKLSSYNLAGKLSLPQIITLIDKARFVLCNDSGLMHLAAATDTPIYALFTSTIPEFGFIPLSPQAKILMAKDISCRPCSHIGLSKCPKKHFRCAYELTPQMVFREIVK